MADNRSRTLVEMSGISVRFKDHYALSSIDWRLDAGANWAVTGPTGAGKTTLLRLIRGEVWPCPDSGLRTYFHGRTTRKSPLGFKERTRLVSLEQLDTYRRRGWALNGREVVISGLADTELLHAPPSREQQEAAMAALGSVGQEDKWNRPITLLSQGEAMKVLLARALVAQPEILILDEAYDGLDIDSRQALADMIQDLAEDGMQLIYASNRQQELIPALSHHLWLEGGRIKRQGLRTRPSRPSQPVRQAQNRPAPVLRTTPPARPAGRPGETPGRSLADHMTGNDRRPLVEIRDADVYIDRRPILRDISWTIRQGENWALLGPNGAGKSTLFKLIGGDLRPALGGSITRFGDPELKNLWTIRRRIGLVSAHTQTAHGRSQSGLETVVSGLTGSIGLCGRPSGEDISKAKAVLDRLEMADLAGADIKGLSYGAVRMLLLARAMITDPEILLLDEPLSGLDPEARLQVSELVDRLAAEGTTFVYATHFPEDLPGSTNRLARVEAGRLVYLGGLEPLTAAA